METRLFCSWFCSSGFFCLDSKGNSDKGGETGTHSVRPFFCRLHFTIISFPMEVPFFVLSGWRFGLHCHRIALLLLEWKQVAGLRELWDFFFPLFVPGGLVGASGDHGLEISIVGSRLFWHWASPIGIFPWVVGQGILTPFEPVLEHRLILFLNASITGRCPTTACRLWDGLRVISADRCLHTKCTFSVCLSRCFFFFFMKFATLLSPT